MADANFKAEFLQKHNLYRKKHRAPDMKMSEALCRSAQAWADHLRSTNKDSRTMSLQHSDTQHGENLYMSFRHFTQVVWKDTTEVGVGCAVVGNCVFVVGQYSPPGNISNEGCFEKNVLPAGRFCMLNPRAHLHMNLHSHISLWLLNRTVFFFFIPPQSKVPEHC
uniref:SCP domain-containing protein n=1 Tax=Denticeps clupeoides TaxID=299321 RepID=A0AAY4E7Z0_9TELE